MLKMENQEIVIKKTSSDIRNHMYLELGLEELSTESSVDFEGEAVQKYDPKINEACKHAPLQIMYEKIGSNAQIRNIRKIKEAVNKSKAKGYILGLPIFFNIPTNQDKILIATFPINFYKLRE